MANSNESKARCTYCGKPLMAGATVREVNRMFKGKSYHPECRSVAIEHTAELPGAIADILRRTKDRAEKTDMAFNLGKDDEGLDAMEYLIKLYRRQNGRCLLSGMPFVLDVDGDWSFHLRPSLDRIDSSKGYVRGNVRFIVQALNYFRSNMTDEQLYEIVDAVHQTRQMQKPGTVYKSSAKPMKRPARARWARFRA